MLSDEQINILRGDWYGKQGITTEQARTALRLAVANRHYEWDDGYNPSLNKDLKEALGGDFRSKDGNFIMWSVVAGRMLSELMEQIEEMQSETDKKIADLLEV